MVMVFAGSIAYAAVELHGRQGSVGDSGVWREFADPNGAWTLRFPAGWDIQPFTERVGHAGFQGAVVSSVDFHFQHPDLGSRSATSAWNMHGLPQDAVVVQLHQLNTLAMTPRPPYSRFPLRLEDSERVHDRPAYGAPQPRLFLPIRVPTGSGYAVSVWFGHDASPSNRSLAARVVASIRFHEPSSLPSPAPSPKPSQSPLPSGGYLTVAQAQKAGLPPSGDSVRGDIDGDGVDDTVTLVRDPRARPIDCQYFLRASTANGLALAHLGPVVLDPPVLIGIATLDPGVAPQVIVNVTPGASYDFFALFTWRSAPGRLVPVALKPPIIGPPRWQSLLSSGASVGTGAEGVSCENGFVLVTNASRQGATVSVTRDFYRLEGSRLMLQPRMTDHVRLPYRDFLRRFPVLAAQGQAFTHCRLIGP